MKKICFLSCQDLVGKTPDDDLAVIEIEKNQDYQVTYRSWDDNADWSYFDLVIIRTTWDYIQRSTEFLAKLKLISSQTKLLNSLDVVKWNYHKGYLKELESKGVAIVPTHLFSFPGEIVIPSDWSYSHFIVKPAISATAFKTMIVERKNLSRPELKQELFEGDWLLQPYLEEIKNGEVSLYFFNGLFSHSIIKKPKAGDFRVQEEWGGDIQGFTPHQELINLSQKVVQSTPFELFYARVDLVNWKGQYVLMELELIEPAIYFSKVLEAPKNFKAGLDKIFNLP